MRRLLFGLLLSIYLLTASLRIDSGDGERMYLVACNLITGQGFAIPVRLDQAANLGTRGQGLTIEQLDYGDGYGKFGPDGRYYAGFGLGWSLTAAPFCALGKALTPLMNGLSEGFVTRTVMLFLNPLLSAATAVVIFSLARRFYPNRQAVTLALLYGIGTIAWYYAKSTFAEPLVVLLFWAAILAIEKGSFGLAGMALGYMLFTRQTSIMLAAPVVVWALARSGMIRASYDLLLGRLSRAASPKAITSLDARTWKQAILLIAPVGVGQLANWWYNVARFGNPLEYGHQAIAWDTPILLGLYGQLFSPGKGMFVFMPVLILGVWGWRLFVKRRSDLAWMFLGVVILYLIPHALFNYWEGGGGWGPRLMLPLVAVILFPAAELLEQSSDKRLRRLVVAGLIAVSIVIQLLGVSVYWGRHLQAVYVSSPSAAEFYDRVHFQWAYSPILGQVQALREAGAILRDPAARSSLESIVAASASTSFPDDPMVAALNLLSMNVPDYWFVSYSFLGAPAIWLACGVLFLGGMVAFMAIKLLGALRREPA